MSGTKKSNNSATSKMTGNSSAGNSPAKKASPPRKSTINRDSKNNVSTTHMVKFADVGMEDHVVATGTKPNGDPAFLAPINREIHRDEDKKARGNIVLHAKQRKSKEENKVLETPSSSGALYNTDIYVLRTEGSMTFHDAAGNLTRLFNEVGRNEAREGYKYGPPSFINKGEIIHHTKPCLHDYLLDEDCVTMIKRTYEGADTKSELMNNEYLEVILETVLGDKQVGFSILEEMDDQEYDEC